MQGKTVNVNGRWAVARRFEKMSSICRDLVARRPCLYRATIVLLMSGCTPAALTALSVGGGAGIQHTMNGISYRTFTAPISEVSLATRSALDRMGVSNIVLHKTADGTVFSANAGERNVEVELVSITPKATRMRTSVRSGMLMDSATGNEIILQTERTLGNVRRTSL
jgi:hypothetical protein